MPSALPHPVSVNVETFGTGKIPDEKIAAAGAEHFDLRPGAIIHDLDLRRPIYRKVAAYGHFGRDDLDLASGKELIRPPRYSGRAIKNNEGWNEFQPFLFFENQVTFGCTHPKVDLQRLASFRFFVAKIQHRAPAPLPLFGFTDDLQFFQPVHQARRTGIADAQFSLQQRDRCAFFLAHNINGFVEIFVLTDIRCFIKKGAWVKVAEGYTF